MYDVAVNGAIHFLSYTILNIFNEEGIIISNETSVLHCASSLPDIGLSPYGRLESISLRKVSCDRVASPSLINITLTIVDIS